MIRKKQNYRADTVYEHRSASYSHRANYVDMAHISALFEAAKSEEEQYVLPPKQPTPDVILRDDIMPNQRKRVSL